MQLTAINFHVWKYCNYQCKFCFATFEDVPLQVKRDQALAVLDALAPHEVEKITFVGGEPTLCPFLDDLICRADELGMVTSVVTNGTRLGPLLDRCGDRIDWIGLSIDSHDDEVSAALGRGTGDHVRQCVELADRIAALGIHLKLNTVVTALNWQEDMSELVRRIRPERWKVFQVLPVRGQNDGVEPLLVTAAQFQAYLDRHAHLDPVGEDNAAMTGSYVMIDPAGRFFDNVDGQLAYGRSILDVGAEAAFGDVRFERERLVARGGLYPLRPRR
ncbi:MAG TPA: viperin family antiviral radical SAM protein [Kofleriaceae bacterium]|jgi:radical S-adenosyl methionine domain-containing protein 2